MKYGYRSATPGEVVFLAYAGGCFWGAGATERAAVRRAQLNHLHTSGETLQAADIETREVDGAVALSIVEKSSESGWASIYTADACSPGA